MKSNTVGRLVLRLVCVFSLVGMQIHLHGVHAPLGVEALVSGGLEHDLHLCAYFHLFKEWVYKGEVIFKK